MESEEQSLQQSGCEILMSEDQLFQHWGTNHQSQSHGLDLKERFEWKMSYETGFQLGLVASGFLLTLIRLLFTAEP